MSRDRRRSLRATPFETHTCRAGSLHCPMILARMLLSACVALLVPLAVPARLGGPAAPSSGGEKQVAAPAAEKAPPKREVTTYTLPPETYAKAVAYARAWYALYFARSAYGLALLLAVLRWRVAPTFRVWAERLASRRIVQAGVFAALLLFTLRLLRLPPAICGHWLSLKFDQSVQGWASWAWDWLKGALINILVGAFLTWLLYAVIRRSPRRWWLYFWFALVPLIVLGAFLDPLVVDPLFYKFQPLEQAHPQLVSEIERVAQRGGLAIPRERILEMKASEKLKAANAYVTGLGASKRVVVWDTTLRMLDTPQTLSLFGHEMGHYVLHHVWRGIGFAAVVLFVFLALVFRLAHAAVRRWGPQWDIRGMEDWASLPVLLLLTALAGFLVSPGIQAYSRYLEHQADVYGLEVTHGLVPEAGQAAAETQQILSAAGLDDPDPPAFIVFWLYSHPPARQRIEFARAYDPWSKGQSPEFVK